MSTFNICPNSDGIPSKYGNHYGIDLSEAVEELIYFDEFSEKYSEEELEAVLEAIKPGDYQCFGGRWSEFVVSKNK